MFVVFERICDLYLILCGNVWVLLGLERDIIMDVMMFLVRRVCWLFLCFFVIINVGKLNISVFSNVGG